MARLRLRRRAGVQRQLRVAYAQIAFGITEQRRPAQRWHRAEQGQQAGQAGPLAAGVGPPHGGMLISFSGNVEGTGLLTGKVDVIVTDGFTGKVALKAQSEPTD
jgi:glycerol-3-phosphate acyltransferase PlsX